MGDRPAGRASPQPVAVGHRQQQALAARQVRGAPRMTLRRVCRSPLTRVPVPETAEPSQADIVMHPRMGAPAHFGGKRLALASPDPSNWNPSRLQRAPGCPSPETTLPRTRESAACSWHHLLLSDEY